MPELPEIETIKRYLSTRIVGKHIANIDVLSEKQLIGKKEEAIGKQVTGLSRQGKVLVIELSEETYLSFHLKLSGQILFSKNHQEALFKHLIPMANTSTMPGRSTRLIIKFTDDSALFFNDMRKFGWMKISSKPEGPSSPDILSPSFTENYFKHVVKVSKKPIKILLMDQEKMAGIGNIYANDSLFDARIHPEIRAINLTDTQIATLYKSIHRIINHSINKKGSSGKDELYILPDGTKGEYQHSFLTYQREHKPCLVCGTKIQRIKQGGRSSFFCPVCQLL
jgi:formamidopyrimidine-DNA glycosylase